MTAFRIFAFESEAAGGLKVASLDAVFAGTRVATTALNAALLGQGVVTTTIFPVLHVRPFYRGERRPRFAARTLSIPGVTTGTPTTRRLPARFTQRWTPRLRLTTQPLTRLTPRYAGVQRQPFRAARRTAPSLAVFGIAHTLPPRYGRLWTPRVGKQALPPRIISSGAALDSILAPKQTTGVLSTSLTALLQQLGNVKTTLLDAILPGFITNSLTASLNALLQKLAVTDSAVMDAVLNSAAVAHNSKTTSLNSLLQQAGKTDTASLSAILALSHSNSLIASLDSIRQASGVTRTSVLDATLFAVLPPTVMRLTDVLDGLLLRTGRFITTGLDSHPFSPGIVAQERAVRVEAENRTAIATI